MSQEREEDVRSEYSEDFENISLEGYNDNDYNPFDDDLEEEGEGERDEGQREDKEDEEDEGRESSRPETADHHIPMTTTEQNFDTNSLIQLKEKLADF